MATKSSVKKPNPALVFWENLPPARKKLVVAVLTLSAVLLVSLAVISTDTSGGPKKVGAQAQMENVLMPEDGVRDLGVSGTSSRLRETQGKLRTLEGEVARLKQQLARSQESGGAGSNDKRMVDEIAELKSSQSALTDEIKSLRESQSQASALEAAQAAAAAQTQPSAARNFGGIRAVDQQSEESRKTEYAAPASGSAPVGPNAPSGTQPSAQVEPKAADAVAASLPRKAADKIFFIPAGSILQGVLLSGVDAPSGKAAMKDPVPVLARIKHNAILPNRYTANIRECFVLLETVGDLASERAMMRVVTLSCVRNDRSVMEVALSGYAVGEDGKAGMRGKVITRQGSVLGMAMLSGFADGLSRAFGGSEGGLGTISTEALQQGGIAGSSTALQNVSKWYLERADELTPTITIDSGRKITIVVTKGRDLAPLATSAGPNTRTVKLDMPRH